MAVIATDTLPFSNTFKHVYEPSMAYCFDVVTVNETAAKNYVVGTVLGKVTATGKYKLMEATAADGSQNAAGVVDAAVAIAANTDTKVRVAVRGPVTVGKAGLFPGASVDTQPEKDAMYASLAALNPPILALDQI
jgi:hypothetical protein